VIMMKQVQDPPPSILDSRPDLPASVENLIERALAKQPADRFQTAGELSTALSQAADEIGAGASAVVPPVADTVPNAPVDMTADDLDEVTVVQPRDQAAFVRTAGGPPVRQGSERGLLVNFSPWRIMVPAAIVVVAVFGLVFLLTRGTGQTPSNQTNAQAPGQNGLASDPNGQPVTPTGPATGESERGIQPGAASPSPRNANAAPSATQETPTTVVGDPGANSNTSGGGNKNANQRESPTPKSAPTVDTSGPPPPPRPSPSAKTAPKPAITPPTR
jgi:hypothetical protein